MNHVPGFNRASAEIERIREIVARHPLPAHATGFHVELDEFDGHPILWVVFKAPASADALDYTENKAAFEADRVITAGIRDDLLEAIESRYPHFRFQTYSHEASADH